MTLVLWTSVIAVGFGFIRYGRSHWGWNAEVVAWRFIQAMPVIGLCNALLAVLWLWAVTATGWRWRLAKTAIAVLLIGILVASQSYLVGMMTGGTPLTVRDCAVLASAQSFLIGLTLVVVLAGSRMRSHNGAVEPRASNRLESSKV